MKKKLAALLLGTMMVVSVVGCGADEEKEVVESTESEEATEEVSAEPAASGAFDLKAGDYVTLSDYENIAVTISKDYEMNDEELEKYITNWMDSEGPYYKEVTDRTVIKEGDIVNLDYVGKLDGVAFDGGTAENQLIDVYNNRSADGTTYIEGFTDGIKGASVGDVVDCDVTFPENYGNADLAGKEVVFTFTINSIQKPMTFDEFDDAYVAENIEDAETVDELREQLEKECEQQLAYYKWYDISTQIQTYLKDSCTVEIPEDYLSARVADYKKQFVEYYCGGDESQLETVISTYFGSTSEEMEESWKTEQESSIRIELILQAIAEEMGLTLDEEKFASYAASMVSGNGYGTEETMYALYGYGDAAYGEQYFRELYVCNMALEELTKNAEVTVDATPEESEAAEETEVKE